MSEEKRVNVEFCEEKLYLTEEEIPKYQKKAEDLKEMAIRAGYTKERAEKEFYLKILKG